MVHVECTIINTETFKIISTVNKNFKNGHEFNEFYSFAKDDPSMLLNIMYYDPYAFSIKKDVYDAKLLRLTKENPV